MITLHSIKWKLIHAWHHILWKRRITKEQAIKIAENISENTIIDIIPHPHLENKSFLKFKMKGEEDDDDYAFMLDHNVNELIEHDIQYAIFVVG